MELVAHLSSAYRRELFAETAARKNMTPAIVDKNFWVCGTLGRLFAHPDLSRLLMFNGGGGRISLNENIAKLEFAITTTPCKHTR